MNDNSPVTVTPTPGPAASSTVPPAETGSVQPVTPPPAKKSGGMKSMLMWLLAIIVALALGAGGYVYGKTKAPTKEVTKTVTAPEATLTVPQGATVLSQCVKGKGAEYALPKDIPTGPNYLVNKGKVIGLEYMVGKDDLFNGKSFLNLPMFKIKYDHINIGLLSQGHAGFPVPHYHVDVFMVPDSEASAITCAT